MTFVGVALKLLPVYCFLVIQLSGRLCNRGYCYCKSQSHVSSEKESSLGKQNALRRFLSEIS